MLKKMLAKRTDKFAFHNGVLELKLEDEKVSLFPSDVDDLMFNESGSSVAILYGVNKVTIDLKNSQQYEAFRIELLQFLGNDKLALIKRKTIKKLAVGISVLAPIATIICIFFYERFGGISFLILGIIIFSIVSIFFHIKKLNKYFMLKQTS